ncbi:hypothetical protein RB597_000469 [Gaeumannomyces tritici]
MDPHASVMSRQSPPLGPIRRRSKQRTSPVGVEDWSARRPWAESDRGQGQVGAFYSSTPDRETAIRGMATVDISHRNLDVTGREGLTSGTRAGSGPLRHEQLAGSAGPAHSHPTPQFSLPNPLEVRTGYDFGHHGQHTSYSYPAQSPIHENGHPHQEQHSTFNYASQSQSHGHSQPAHAQHGHAPPSYHHSHQNGVQGWYGNSSSQAQEAPAASNYVHTTSGGRSPDSTHQSRLGLRTSSPPFTAPLLQAEISQLATATPQQLGPHSPPVPRDLSHLLHHSDEPRAPDSLNGARQSHYGVASYDPVRAHRYPQHQQSPGFSSQTPSSEPAHSRVDASVPVSVNTSGVSTGALSFSTSPVHPQVTSTYGHGYADHHKPQLPAVSADPGLAAPRASPTYTHPNYNAASSSGNYQLSPAESHRTPRDGGYAGQGHQHSVGDGQECWLMMGPGTSSGEESSPPQHTPDQNGYQHSQIAESAVIPLLTSNGNGEAWVDTSAGMSRQEIEPAAHAQQGQAKTSPTPSGKGRKAGLKKTRGKFTDEKRLETARTRKNGACIRCKCQRVRCDPTDPDDPSAPCQSCLKVNQHSKKMIHACICRRYRLTDMVLSRQGGLGMTTRWSGTLMKDVSDRVDDLVRIVELKIFYSHHPQRLDLYHYPIRFAVHRFRPKEGDVLHRRWKTRDNVPMITEMTPFALNDINQSAADLDQFISDHVFEAMRAAVQDSELIVRETYEMAIDYFRSLEPEHEERIFLGHLFRLWFAMRLTTGSAYISGQDKLDMFPEAHPDYPLGERISLPRMITAQVDSILSTKFLKPGTTKVTKCLEKFLRSNDPAYWFSLYLSIFIILHEISVATKDRGRYARDNQLPTRFSLPSVVREQHFGANNLLAHWHYYKTEIDPSNVESWKLHKSSMGRMTQAQRSFVWRWWHWMRRPGMLESLCPDGQREQEARWEDPLFFACQIYMPGWREKAVYQGY